MHKEIINNTVHKKQDRVVNWQLNKIMKSDLIDRSFFCFSKCLRKYTKCKFQYLVYFDKYSMVICYNLNIGNKRKISFEKKL